MKKKIITACVFLLGTIQLYAQQSNIRQGCDFLHDISFKDGIDTVFVLANNKWNIKSPPLNDALQSFYKTINVNPENITFNISFTPLNCTEKFVVDCADPKAFEIANNHPETVLKLRCIVFDKYITNSAKRYFLVDKVELQKE